MYLDAEGSELLELLEMLDVPYRAARDTHCQIFVSASRATVAPEGKDVVICGEWCHRLQTLGNA